MHRSLILRVLILLTAAGLLGGCFPQGQTEAPVRVTVAAATAAATATPAPPQFITPAAPGATLPPTRAPSPTAAPTATPAPKPARGTIGLDAAPGAAATGPILALLNLAGIKSEQVTSDPDLKLTGEQTDGGVLAWEQVLTPVDRMSTVLQSIELTELKGVWTGASASPNFTNIYVAPENVAAVSAVLGQPGEAVKPTAAGEIDAAVWGDKMGLGLVPFDSLTVRLRAIPVDGQTPVSNRFDGAKWPLTARGYVAPLSERGKTALSKLVERLPVRNRDAGKLTTLVMTGVTAMARNSAVAIDRSGDWGFLGRLVGPELAAADITIISNEIPFIKGCQADNRLNNLILCSRYEYWENLSLSGVDAIGLSGNHQNDFGYAAMLESLAFYDEKKAPYYGGGRDEKAAWQPLIIEHNGNRLGFLGANQWGPEWYINGKGENVSSWAGPDYPGSARFTLERMSQAIQALKPQVDLVFAEVQHTEFNAAGDYQTEPLQQQEIDFRGMIDAGADVVTGVQAHAPQAMELRNGKPILYGLGNLYFDQTWSWPTRTGLVARHTIYDGRVINTELLVTVIEKNFQLRWATPEERAQVLRSVLDVSRW